MYTRVTEKQNMSLFFTSDQAGQWSLRVHSPAPRLCGKSSLVFTWVLEVGGGCTGLGHGGTELWYTYGQAPSRDE